MGNADNECMFYVIGVFVPFPMVWSGLHHTILDRVVYRSHRFKRRSYSKSYVSCVSVSCSRDCIPNAKVDFVCRHAAGMQ